jgi:hypothetical protein
MEAVWNPRNLKGGREGKRDPITFEKGGFGVCVWDRMKKIESQERESVWYIV